MRRRELSVVAGIVAACLLALGPVVTHEFVNLDDADYVSANPHVLRGLSAEGTRWAFTTFRNGNWHPLTWISHMLDVQLFGPTPGASHAVSLFLHAAGAGALFLALRRMTQRLWESAFVAALFALHPLHVESVAWASERKDVLCGLFWACTLLCWARYARSPGWGWYIASLVCAAAGLLSKPMLISLPFVLLLLDFWPLGRLRPWAPGARPGEASRPRMPAGRLLLEKAPFFVLSAASGAVTLLAQGSAGAIASVDALPAGLRVANAALSYVRYIGRAFWPSGLAVFYPMGPPPPAWRTAAAAVFLLAVTGVALHQARRIPWLAVGWLFYLVTLLPVIGLVQVGAQSSADRYTYIPLTGLFVIAAWGGAGIARALGAGRALPGLTAAAIVAIMAVLARGQVGHWRDSVSLFTHASAVTRDNWLAHANLAAALARRGATREAEAHYAEALRLRPGYARAHGNLGLLLVREGRAADAEEHLRQAVGLAPDSVEALNNLGGLVARTGKLEEAVALFRRAAQLAPEDGGSRFNLGSALLRQGNRDEAIAQLAAAARLDPVSAEVRNNLGVALAAAGRLAEAESEYREALRLRPLYAACRLNLGDALAAGGRIEEARREYAAAVSADPALELARQRLEMLRSGADRPRAAGP